MEKVILNRVFDNISQRVAVSYVRSLAEYAPVIPAGVFSPLEIEQSERDLHNFFEKFYGALFESPELFGLPLDGDVFVEIDHHDTDQKQKVTRKVKKPREMVEQGIGFLLLAGEKGTLNAREMVLDGGDYITFLGKSKAKKQFLKGFDAVGLKITFDGTKAILSSEKFPAMMFALKMLAEVCAKNGRVGMFNFSSCDFRGLNPDFEPAALDLYRVFNPEDYARLIQLHAYLAQMNYKPVCQYPAIAGWEVQYQGRKEVKGSPLLRIEYSERYKNQLRIGIKCASSSRLIPLIYEQPHFLQEDFYKRVYPCRGSECGWCEGRKNLGPAVLEFNGQARSICWYSNPDIVEFNEDTVNLIQQYVVMHEALA